MGLVLKNTLNLLKKFWFLYSLIIFLYGCGSADEDKVSFAVTEAEIYLNTGDCTGALRRPSGEYSQCLIPRLVCAESPT